MFGQLHLHPVHGHTSQQSVLLREQPHEGPDGADAAQLRDAAGAHLHAAAGPLHSAAQSVTGQLSVSAFLQCVCHQLPSFSCESFILVMLQRFCNLIKSLLPLQLIRRDVE